jgi:hypothetical protein
MATKLVNGELVEMTPEEEAAFEASRQPVDIVPQVVEMAKARKVLHLAGKLTIVQAAIAAMPEPAKTIALIDWEYETQIHRSNPLVLQLEPLLGGAAVVDDLFKAAALL